MIDSTTPPDWAAQLRDVPDFPKPGILFKDITPLLADGAAFAAAIASMVAPWRDARPDAVLGIESRGFILGAAMAHALGCGFVPVRKPGKLPGHTLRQPYALEYGSDCVEVHADAVAAGARIVLVDDVLATGGTLLAGLALAQQLRAQVLGAGVLVELAGLGGRARWPGEVELVAGVVV